MYLYSQILEFVNNVIVLYSCNKEPRIMHLNISLNSINIIYEMFQDNNVLYALQVFECQKLVNMYT